MQERIQAAGALAAADGAALEVQPHMGPELRTSFPDFKNPVIAAHQGASIAVTHP